jgi:hypothetical protein
MREGQTSKRTVTPLKTRHLTRLVMASLRNKINAIMILNGEPPLSSTRNPYILVRYGDYASITQQRRLHDGVAVGWRCRFAEQQALGIGGISAQFSHLPCFIDMLTGMKSPNDALLRRTASCKGEHRLAGYRCPCPGYQVGSELETTTNATGKIAREIVHPCMAINPTARSVFGAVDLVSIRCTPTVLLRCQRHTGQG